MRVCLGYCTFISIHSLRMEGDAVKSHSGNPVFYFNPLPPYGGRLFVARNICRESDFNPLPPYGGRHRSRMIGSAATPFQSTPSVWRETSKFADSLEKCGISIHSLRMEGDMYTARPPRLQIGFQSTPSVWRETVSVADGIQKRFISIHSLRMEGDGDINNHDFVG